MVVLKAAKKASKSLTWEQIDNQFIISGYRPQSNSFFVSFTSLLYLHNESINIYSHLIGAIAFFKTGVSFYAELCDRYPSCNSADIYVFTIFLLSAATCFILSAVCHLILNHSHSSVRLGTTLDYLGIIVFIVGTCVSGFYYGLREHESLLHLYWTMIVAAGILCTFAVVNPAFHTPPWRPIRAATFIGLGLFSIIPILHGIYIYGFATLEKMMGLQWTFVQGALYILGCVIFVLRVPERWYPGTFDLFGASHQVFHFCALAAAASQLKALLLAFDFRHGQ
ncbi:hypothetical protein OIDMADRAFT_105156 [Oidiodendron maius Zn]|uniref:Uncharacterized protein n=1 Tax=Oidiodendron maius (strain Zn) TaxID=913774 RepID=A0A0C3GRS6_OIDMZ|nr:hypothetical protein OIDMADRAFT_105156 [Oidiodendron maius Zn]